MDTEIILDTKLVGDIQGKFIIPSYQRGYRWGESEVTRLLDDIYANGEKNYCLQPVVVKRDEKERFELIEGQRGLSVPRGNSLPSIWRILRRIWPTPTLIFFTSTAPIKR